MALRGKCWETIIEFSAASGVRTRHKVSWARPLVPAAEFRAAGRLQHQYKYNVTLPNQTFICKQPECAIKCADANVINDRKYFSTIKRFLKTRNVTACVQSECCGAGRGGLVVIIPHYTSHPPRDHSSHVTRDT